VLFVSGRQAKDEVQIAKVDRVFADALQLSVVDRAVWDGDAA
jgi:hypothetical protein